MFSTRRAAFAWHGATVGDMVEVREGGPYSRSSSVGTSGKLVERMLFTITIGVIHRLFSALAQLVADRADEDIADAAGALVGNALDCGPA
jgi:hypothetical protein